MRGRDGNRGTSGGRRLTAALVVSVLMPILALSVGVARALAIPTAAYLAEDRRLVDIEAQAEAGKLGVALPSPAAGFIQIKQSTRNTLPVTGRTDGVKEAAADTDCRYTAGGALVYCLIEFAVAPHLHGEFPATVAHEVFHIFEAVMAGSRANFHREIKESDWLIEGAAVWAESELYFGARLAAGERGYYYRTPATPLFQRTYDGVGFFDNIKANGVSPWTRMPAIFAAQSNVASYLAAVGANEKSFLASQASVYFLEDPPGFPWAPRAEEPIDLGARYSIPSVAVGRSGHAPLRAKAYTVSVQHLSLLGMSKSQPLLEVEVVKGTASLRSTGGSVDTVIEGTITLCSASESDCNCPSMSPEHYPIFDRGDLAISGGRAGAEVRLTVRKKCQPPLGARSCVGLVSGFSTGPGQALERAVQEPFSVIVTGSVAKGFISYTCAFLARGVILHRVVKKETEEFHQPIFYNEEEEYFRGALIPLLTVGWYTNSAAAASAVEIDAKIDAKIGLHEVAIGQFAEEGTKPAFNSFGEREYSSFAVIQVRNIVIYFSVGGAEAGEAETLAMMREAAARA